MLLASAVCLAALAQGQPVWDAAAWPPAPERGRDIWVFRSVLDQRARMATIALHDDLWAAFDAENCGIYKVWKGGVKFDGAVYTASHGPQPTSEGAAFSVNDTDQAAWAIGAQRSPVKPLYRGHTFEKGRVYFTYEFTLPGGRKAFVDEAVEHLPVPQGAGLFRAFRTRGFGATPVGVRQTARASTTTSFSDVEWTRAGWTRLNTSGTTLVREYFAAPIPKVESFEESAESELSASTEAQPPSGALAANREPGLAMRVYSLEASPSLIPILVAGQTANVNRVIPKVDLSTTADFGGVADNFLVHITGYLNIAVEGMYQFRLTSDDGSRLTIRDEIIVDNDGLHGATPAEGSFRLSPGEHPLFIEYFEGQADNVLKLEWKTPGAASWEVVPTEALSTLKGEVRVTAPGFKNVMTPGEGRRPGDQRPLVGVHPAFDLAKVRPSDFRPRVGGMDFLPDGRLVVCNWEPDGGVYLLDSVAGASPRPKVTRIAKGLAEPLGLKVVGGKIYVLQKQELTRLDDLDGDGTIDRYYALANGWGVTSNFHEFAFGLAHRRGHFYANLAIAINPGGASTQPQNPDRGKVLRINDRTGAYEFVADGLRTPNGIGFGPGGELFITDNQGDWLPSSKMVHLTTGAFFGSRAVEPARRAKTPETPPVVWLPQNEIGNSPSEPTTLNLGPYRGQMLHGDVTHGGLKRTFLEKVNGQYQGVVFRFTQGLEAGVNRVAWGPDNALYVGGIGSTGNWGQEGKERYGLEKLSWNGRVPFEMLAVRSRANGFEIEFTQPIAEGAGLSPAAWRVQDWRYVPTVEYGGPKVDTRRLKVSSVTISTDRRRAFLELPEVEKGRVVYFHLDPLLLSQTGELLWSTEAWYTLNSIASAKGVVRPAVLAEPNTLTKQEEADGWRLLFDGKSLDNWVRYGSSEPAGSAWKAGSGEFSIEPGSGRGGDIGTKESYSDFEFSLEWKAAPGGNSGVFYRVDPARGPAWATGPEFQLLDDARHGDGANELTAAGSNYAVHPAKKWATRPAGEWNQSLIRAKGNVVEHWMNGVLIVRYELQSEDWKQRVAKSKFAGQEFYGKAAAGRIVLQDHGFRFSFRNVKVRRLTGSS